jgi:hypothetical protein
VTVWVAVQSKKLPAAKLAAVQPVIVVAPGSLTDTFVRATLPLFVTLIS